MKQNGQPEAIQQGIAKINRLASERRPFLFVLDYALLHPIILPLEEIDPEEILYDINGMTNAVAGEKKHDGKLSLVKHPVPFPEYHRAFKEVMAELEYGNSFLLNLTFSTPIELNLSLEEVFTGSRAKYKLYVRKPLSVLNHEEREGDVENYEGTEESQRVQADPGVGQVQTPLNYEGQEGGDSYANDFVVFSPETFVKIKDRRISTYPMKGTIDAAVPDAHKKILENPKEKAEHLTIVDLLRNDLSRVAQDVKVDRFRYIEEVVTHEKTLLQVSSEISGRLPEDYHRQLGDILCSLLPAGSISGAPKAKTVEILGNAESHQRGYFTGIFGYFDGRDLDSGVMIRFIERQGDQDIFKSGGGITTQSNAEEEYQEMIDKVYVPIY